MEAIIVNNSPALGTPDETVADQIVRRLVAAGLLPPQYANQTRNQLATGALRAEDWRLLAEKAIELAGWEESHE